MEVSQAIRDSVHIQDVQSPVGLIAGNGQFPIEFAKAAKRLKIAVVALAHRGETDQIIEDLVDRVVWIRVGQLGKIIRVLKQAKVRQAAFAGGISRIKLIGGVKLDWRGVRLVSRIRSVKDDAILRGAAGEIESEGIRVISASVILHEMVAAPGYISNRTLSKDELSDALIGWEACKAIGELDIGQTVIAASGLVVAVEGVEGTDAALRRGGSLSRNGVVVKLVKPQQDLRLDLPTVGPNTVAIMKEAGLKALVIESGRTLVLEPTIVAHEADAAGIAIVAVSSREELKGLVR